MAVDEIAKKLNISVEKDKFDAKIGEGIFQGQKIMLVKPQTYMNLSGECVIQLIHYYKVLPEDLIVIYDDIDIEFGKIRIRPSGSAGTHNGMRNITKMLGTEEFTRIRIGTGKVPQEVMLTDFVLMNFSKEEREIMKEVMQITYCAIIEILDNGVKSAMNLYNSNKGENKL